MKARPSPVPRPALGLFLALLGAPAAQANEIPCGLLEAGTVRIDGLLGDWKDVEGAGADQESQILRGQKEWSGPRDLSFDVYCNYDEANLYLAVNVKDEYFIRTRQAKGDDHVEVMFSGKTLLVYPGNLRDVPLRLTWGQRGKAKGIEAAEAMQTGGYSVELRIPWKGVPGYRAGVSAIPGAIAVADSDSRAQMKVQTVMATAASTKRGAFVFTQASADLSSFLKDRGYSSGQVRTKLSADVVGDRRQEQVVLVGRTIGIVGDGLPGGSYFYLDLGVKQPRDIYWLKVMDLNGDGKGELVTRYIERAGNGRRELLAVFRFTQGEKFVRSFAHEILKGQGERMIVNRFALKPWRGGKKKHGIDIIVDKPVAHGFSEETYRETPSSDAHPILLPWSEPRKRRFRFEGDEFSEL